MGRVGACADNAAMESFFALLRKNLLDRQRWATREELRFAIVTWIKRAYLRRRQQAVPGRLTPLEFETILMAGSHQRRMRRMPRLARFCRLSRLPSHQPALPEDLDPDHHQPARQGLGRHPGRARPGISLNAVNAHHGRTRRRPSQSGSVCGVNRTPRVLSDLASPRGVESGKTRERQSAVARARSRCWVAIVVPDTRRTCRAP